MFENVGPGIIPLSLYGLQIVQTLIQSITSRFSGRKSKMWTSCNSIARGGDGSVWKLQITADQCNFKLKWPQITV